ncbi:hypothetical protein CLV24_1632 [Pontibacter ummariensis]|uniref:Uncharacterized protein n=1 Tax=Pontibacter ummariensis TaxID=1610492 RepID=A0A239M338_9BACT|nr:hypothetical protein CLV24_1632 [Pontibacter ummariensis]SNT36374.1 hypothetical protein SAMN06296052_1642 [Pontibacter ummariensis]
MCSAMATAKRSFAVSAPLPTEEEVADQGQQVYMIFKKTESAHCFTYLLLSFTELRKEVQKNISHGNASCY